MDACLARGPHAANGATLVGFVTRLREQKPNGVTGLGPTRFDDKSKMILSRRSDTVFAVRCTNVLRSRKKGKETIYYRGALQHDVVLVDGEYKVIIRWEKKKED